MRAEKAIWLRPACGYVAAAVCVAIAAWGASRPPPTFGFVQALDSADRDTQLPLERFAIEAGNAAAPSPQSKTEPQQAAQPLQPNQSIGTSTRNWSGQAQIGFVRLSTPRRKSGAHGYYRKIEDWKNWT
jgi:hypothetical protein